MTRVIITSFLFSIALGFAAPVFAEPGEFGNAVSVAAEQGAITPHGVWDRR